MASSYPTALDDVSSLLLPLDKDSGNSLTTSLSASCLAADTTLSVVSTAGFQPYTVLSIGDEQIVPTGKTLTTFTGCIRGAEGTVATGHSNGAAVTAKMVAAYIEHLQSAVIAIENTIGITGAFNFVQSSRNIATGTGLTGGGDLSADRTLSVVDNTTIQKVQVAKAGSTIGTRSKINIIEGGNMTITVADNGGGDRVDITFASAGGGGGGSVTSVFARTGAVAAQSGDYAANQITNTPAGNIAATDVQAALNELDTEKAAASHTHAAADITSGTLAGARMPAFTGDLSSAGGTSAVTVVGLRGRTVASTAPSTGQPLYWDGSNWTPAPYFTIGANSGGNISYGVFNKPALKVLHSGTAFSPGTAFQASTGYPTTSGTGSYEAFGCYVDSFATCILTVRDNGFVGINTSSPGAELDMYVGGTRIFYVDANGFTIPGSKWIKSNGVIYLETNTSSLFTKNASVVDGYFAYWLASGSYRELIGKSPSQSRALLDVYQTTQTYSQAQANALFLTSSSLTPYRLISDSYNQSQVYTQSQTNAQITAALVPYYTAANVNTLLANYAHSGHRHNVDIGGITYTSGTEF